jgi:hypothetical protein
LINEGIQSYEYRILKLASGVMVCAIEPPSDSIKNALESGGLLEEAIDAPFDDLVSKIGRELVLILNDGVKSNTVLAQDIRSRVI